MQPGQPTGHHSLLWLPPTQCAGLRVGVAIRAPPFADSPPEPAESASLLNPLKQQEVATGFTIAELYQAMHQDIAAGLYDESGILNRAQWTYDELTGACTAAITLATQQGRDRFAPTPTPPLDRLETCAYAAGTSEESDETTTTTKTFPAMNHRGKGRRRRVFVAAGGDFRR